jgi:hypothetical protein
MIIVVMADDDSIYMRDVCNFTGLLCVSRWSKP